MSFLLSGESAWRALRWCCQDRTHQVMGSSSSSCPSQVWYSRNNLAVPEKGDFPAKQRTQKELRAGQHTHTTQRGLQPCAAAGCTHNLADLLATVPVNQAGRVHPRGQHRQHPAHGRERSLFLDGGGGVLAWCLWCATVSFVTIFVCLFFSLGLRKHGDSRERHSRPPPARPIVCVSLSGTTFPIHHPFVPRTPAACRSRQRPFGSGMLHGFHGLRQDCLVPYCVVCCLSV
jgi:hypothetical protein